MADTILLVFEGERAEPKIFDSLKKTFFGSETNSIIQASYNAEIYQLWKQVRDDEFLDVVELLRERSEKNRISLAGIERDQVSQIFLFFDYEGHATDATDEKIQKMLGHFNEETENGKLYISYPMVEALKHLSPDFQNQTVPAKQNINYKQMVAESSSPYQDMRKVDANDWKHIISENLKKGNFIACSQYALPESPTSQPEIFKGQLVNFIDPLSEVSVLSGIPFFVVEYFGMRQIIT